MPNPAVPADAERTPVDDPALIAEIEAIARGHGLGALPLARYTSGSLPVFALGEVAALKFYPADEADHAEVEARVLAAIDGRLPLATPRVLGRGARADGTYLLMSQLPGRRLVQAWAGLRPADREGVVEQVGAALAALHAIDPAPLADLPGPVWPAFVAAQRTSAAERQRERGLDTAWVDRIDAFLDQWAPAATGPTVLLHTEVMREHLLVAPHAGGWTCTGLIDFEPAMRGARAYEFASVGLFVTCGDGRLLHRLLRAYGQPDLAHDAALPQRLMAMALLHRYSHLRGYLERLPAPGAATIDALAQRWFGPDPGA
jgi:hygromycin-B 7''-O-kinase